MAIIDPIALKIIVKIPVGQDPHEIIASTDGKTAYVTNTGGGRAHEINVIDLVGQQPMPNIDTKSFLGPHGIVFVGGKAWFSAEGAKAVGRYDPVSKQIDWSMGTGEDRTHMIFVTPDEKRVYTTNVNAGTVSILVDTVFYPVTPPNVVPTSNTPPRKEWIHTVVKAGKGCEGFDVSPDGKQLWTVAASDGSISIIDVMSKKLIASIDAQALGANRLKFTPDGKRVLISSLRIGDMFVIDVASRKEIKRVNIGKGGAGILVEPNGSRAFVGCTQDNYVAVIDLKTLEVVNRITLGGPDGLAWSSK